MKTSDRPPIALTMGDPAGIGPEITAGAWMARQAMGLPPFFVIGDPALYAARVPVAEIADAAETAAQFDRALPVMALALPAPVTPGRPDPALAPAILHAIDRAVALTLSGEACAVTTNPIAKAVLYQAGFTAAGHTDYLALRCGLAPEAAVMMLVGGGLRTVPATIHIPLADVPKALNPAALEQTIRTTHADLIRRFRIPRPRLSVTGLNPHAGEGGTLGREEVDWIAPLCDRLRAEGLALAGPVSADALFHEDARAGYDAVVALYHDQALIPVKTLAFHDGVNVTLGLPILRTSPDHGTAFDIAGQARARPDSLIAALKLAGALA